MGNNTIFKKAEQLYGKLLNVLVEIEAENGGEKIQLYEKSLMEIDQAIRQLKTLVVPLRFESVAEEVYFFKEVKPLFVAQFIYFSKILELEAAKPNAGQYILKNYYEYELQHLKNFVDTYSDFYEYYRRKGTYLDEKYFVRKQSDFKMSIDPNMYNYDENFTTSHDYLIAHIIANDRLERFLLSSIYDIEGYFYEKFSEKSPMVWTSTKSALVELLYALHLMRCFNSGNIDFSETVKFAEKSFNIKLGNFYKTLHEIKSRKTGRTKFMQSLNENLNKHFEEGDA